MADKDGGTRQAPAAKPLRRKIYRAPKLREYGHVSALTQSGGTTKPEQGNPKRRP